MLGLRDRLLRDRLLLVTFGVGRWGVVVVLVGALALGAGGGLVHLEMETIIMMMLNALVMVP